MLISQPQQLRDRLIAYWPCGRAGVVELRSELYGAQGPLDLTNNNAAVWGSGPSANLPDAVDLEAGSTQTLSVLDAPALSMPRTDMSISAWVNLESTPANIMGVAGQWNNTSRGYYLRYSNSSGKLEFTCSSLAGAGDAQTASANSAPTIGVWYFLVGRFELSSRRLSLSVNAVNQSTSATLANPINDSTAPFTIGNEDGLTRYFDGKISQVALWKRLLTDTEIFKMYNNGQGIDLLRGV